MQWKFQSIWKTTDFTNQPTMASFLASTDYLYISDTIVGGLGTYFRLYNGEIELWQDGSKIANWGTAVTSAPVSIEDGVPMGLLLGLTYQT